MSVRCLNFNIFYLETLFCAVCTIWGSSFPVRPFCFLLYMLYRTISSHDKEKTVRKASFFPYGCTIFVFKPPGRTRKIGFYSLALNLLDLYGVGIARCTVYYSSGYYYAVALFKVQLIHGDVLCVVKHHFGGGEFLAHDRNYPP